MLIGLELKAIDITLGIISTILYALKRYTRFIDIAFLGLLSFFAPRLTGSTFLDSYYHVCDKIVGTLGGHKGLAFFIVCGALYLIYYIIYSLPKKNKWKQTNATDIFKYFVALPVTYILTVALWRFAWSITTNDAQMARIFFYFVIGYINYIHYVSFIFEDIFLKPLSKLVLPFYERKLSRLRCKAGELQMKEIELENRLDSCKFK